MRRLQRKDTWRLGVGVFLFIIVFLVFSFIVGAVRLNEIMPHTNNIFGDEWVEIYNENDSNISLINWTIRDLSSNDIINLNISANGFGLIVDSAIGCSAFNVSNESCIELVTIGNGLKDDNESVFLYDENNALVSNFSWNMTIKSSGRSWQFYNNSWQEGSPTPGAINNISAQTNQTNQTNATIKGLELTANLNDIIYLGGEYTGLFKIENLDHITGQTDHINATVYYNITNESSLIKEGYFNITNLNSYTTSDTGEFTPNMAGNYSLCGLIVNSTVNDANSSNDFACKNFTVIDTSSVPCNISINLSSENTIYLTNESIKFYNNLNNETFLYTIEYWKEDLFGAQIGSRTNTTNTNQKSWSPSIDELDQVFFIKNRIAYVACNDTNSTDDYSEKMVVVRGAARTDNSIIQIDEVYLGTDDKAKFGDSLRFKVIIYKGNSTKTSVQAWLEDGSEEKISKTTSTNIYGNYQNHTITIPVQIEANCNGAISDGNYNLVVEGLDAADEETVYVEGTTSSLCQTVTSYKTSSSDTSSQTPLNLEQESEAPTTSFVYDKVRFNIASPTAIEFGKGFVVNITAINTADGEKDFDAWAYVFKGRKSITDPMQNKKHLALGKNESLQFYLPIIVDDENIDPGDYKLMVKLNSSARKSLKSVSKAVELIFNQEYSGKEAISLKSQGETAGKTQAEFDSESFNNELEFDSINKVTGSVVLNADVYESTTVKAKKLVKYFIVSAFGLFVIMLIWRKV
ncbi:MAG: hypothetical protein Q7J54_01845 [Candidatus Woesearchaeota archaeon]|nr:hypothetical protein [Candidatus Woesearchaeota archaeon]